MDDGRFARDKCTEDLRWLIEHDDARKAAYDFVEAHPVGFSQLIREMEDGDKLRRAEAYFQGYLAGERAALSRAEAAERERDRLAEDAEHHARIVAIFTSHDGRRGGWWVEIVEGALTGRGFVPSTRSTGQATQTVKGGE